ncbi:MAG: DUF2029 domain-containing protein [Chitinispirillaceae bacterium]|nr:DUF2029 domain-containing protein [Chitinispirillaceae bacterium]
MVFMIPWAYMAKVNIHGTQVLWYILNCHLFFLSVGLWCRLINKKPFDWFDYRKPLSLFSLFIFLPILFVTSPLLDNACELQVNIIQLFLISIGVYHAAKNRDVLSGFWFGCATAIKAYPLIFLIFLLARGKIKASGMMVATAGILTLLPIVWYGLPDYIVNIKGWLAISLHGGYPLTGAAQSVYAMLGRWITSDVSTMLFGKVHHPPVDTIGSVVTTWLYRGLFVAAMSIFYSIIIRRRYRDIGFEGAFISLVMILFSPIAWKHYWVMTFPVVFVLWNVVLTYKSPVITFLLWTSFVFISVLQVVGSAFRPFRAFANCVLSNYTIGGIVLMAGMIYLAVKGGIPEEKSGTIVLEEK